MAKSSAAKTGVVDALEFLSHPDKHPPASVCAVFGDDAFLKGEVLTAVRKQLLGGDDGEFGLSVFTGREVQLRDVRDALSSVSLFGDGQRVVIIEDADTFVTEHRPELEDYVAKVAGTLRVPSAGNGTRSVPTTRSVLILDVKTWPSNTRLAKAVAVSGMAIKCDAPSDRQAKSWLTQRAKAVHNARLDAAAADALLELVPPELGILVQEIAKLALVVGPDRVIDVKLVQENVGGWRTRATWDMIDAAADDVGREAVWAFAADGLFVAALSHGRSTDRSCREKPAAIAAARCVGPSRRYPFQIGRRRTAASANWAAASEAAYAVAASSRPRDEGLQLVRRACSHGN
jgi:DNA polymerase III subunit delta